jgi:hypothetical protein
LYPTIFFGTCQWLRKKMNRTREPLGPFVLTVELIMISFRHSRKCRVIMHHVSLTLFEQIRSFLFRQLAKLMDETDS